MMTGPFPAHDAGPAVRSARSRVDAPAFGVHQRLLIPSPTCLIDRCRSSALRTLRYPEVDDHIVGGKPRKVGYQRAFAGWVRYFARNGVIVHFFEYLHFLKGRHREIPRLAAVVLHHRLAVHDSCFELSEPPLETGHGDFIFPKISRSPGRAPVPPRASRSPDLTLPARYRMCLMRPVSDRTRAYRNLPSASIEPKYRHRYSAGREHTLAPWPPSERGAIPR